MFAIPAPIQTTKHTRYETLDGMRGVAAICVMVFHYVKGSPYPFLNNSPLAVDLFFMLSGFVIAHSYGQRLRSGMTASAYLAKRFIRLYPMFILGLLVGGPVLYYMQQAGLANGSPRFIAQSLALNLFYLPSINHSEIYNFGASIATRREIFPANPPAWSLFFEIIASVAFLGLFKFKRKALIFTVASAFAVFALSALVPHLHGRFVIDFGQGWHLDNFPGGLPRVIYGFTFGLLLYSLATDPALASLRATIARTIRHPFVLYSLLVLVFLFPSTLRGLYPAFILVVIAPCLVFVGSIVHSDGPASLAATRFLGWLSYPIYCLHSPVGNLVFLLVVTHAHLSPAIAIIGSIIATLLVAIVLTKFIEEPIRTWLTGLNSKSRAGAQA